MNSPIKHLSGTRLHDKIPRNINVQKNEWSYNCGILDGSHRAGINIKNVKYDWYSVYKSIRGNSIFKYNKGRI